MPKPARSVLVPLLSLSLFSFVLGADTQCGALVEVRSGAELTTGGGCRPGTGAMDLRAEVIAVEETGVFEPPFELLTVGDL